MARGKPTLRAFISGTQKEQLHERQRVAAVIRALGIEPVLAEDAPGAAESPETWCVTQAAECDLLIIGIYGDRYGAVPPGMQVSVSELEFNRARDADPTKLILFRFAFTNPEAAQTAFFSRIRQFHDGYLVRDAKDLGELEANVRDGVLDWIAKRVRRAALTPALSAASPPVRHRALVSRDLEFLRTARDSREAMVKIDALKDIVSLSYRAAGVAENPEVRSFLAMCQRGTTAMRAEALRTWRTLYGSVPILERDTVRSKMHQVAFREFGEAKDLMVKQEALNALSLAPEPADLDLLLDHVETSPAEIYGQSRPLTAVVQIAKLVGASEVRGSLYSARDEAESPDIKARLTELIEYLRMQQ
jgi:uncharacterized protein DUF4062